MRTDRHRVFDSEGVLVSEEVVEVDTTIEDNTRTIEDRLREDLAAIDVITSTTNATLDAPRAIKDLARMNKRLIRLVLQELDSTE